MKFQVTKIVSAAALATVLVACADKPKDAAPAPAATAEPSAEAPDTTVAAEVPAEAPTAAEGTPAQPAQ